MREDLGNHGGLFNGGDDLQVAATMRAMFDIDSENALEQARPTQARRCVVYGLGGVFTFILRRTRHDRGTQPGPAKELAIGDELTICSGEYERVITVSGLSMRRGPAALAVQLYEEREESRARRLVQIADRKALGSVAGERKGRPTKRQRRQIIRFRTGA